MYPKTFEYGGAGWSRTNIVYPEGPDLQSGDTHALVSTTPYCLIFKTGYFFSFHPKKSISVAVGILNLYIVPSEDTILNLCQRSDSNRGPPA